VASPRIDSWALQKGFSSRSISVKGTFIFPRTLAAAQPIRPCPRMNTRSSPVPGRRSSSKEDIPSRVPASSTMVWADSGESGSGAEKTPRSRRPIAESPVRPHRGVFPSACPANGVPYTGISAISRLPNASSTWAAAPKAVARVARCRPRICGRGMTWVAPAARSRSACAESSARTAMGASPSFRAVRQRFTLSGSFRLVTMPRAAPARAFARNAPSVGVPQRTRIPSSSSRKASSGSRATTTNGTCLPSSFRI